MAVEPAIPAAHDEGPGGTIGPEDSRYNGGYGSYSSQAQPVESSMTTRIPLQHRGLNYDWKAFEVVVLWHGVPKGKGKGAASSTQHAEGGISNQ